ncbi:hypothetical protein GGX14DRAFT_698845 [Mycena pura]|uniref:Uncharacterized protein n=1 Tax=Mycena pura TaxID=153505 RepID=A0AAD6VE59_9AGAR|nr:hypothetical protein GGX14DRAFT_698845 [Mycena pura]
MVASKTKSNKMGKYTYTERVLGSFWTIQREHKRHAVHLASLRAQVQKTAASRKDKLGPHWKNWVTKAVHKLEEDGILEPSEPAGTLALTPAGKKDILAARRALALPTNDSLLPEQEDLLWKQVTHPGSVLTSHGNKRPRRSYRDSDDSEPEYTPRKPKKRTRMSLPANMTRDPAYKRTKAQLIDELAVLKRRQEAERLRAESPLTEMGDNDSENAEVLQLKETIRQREYEVGALRRELANRNGGDADISDAMSSPARNLNTLVRTQSGSLINLLSKQPTPAPTELDFDEQHHENNGVDPFDEREHDLSDSVPRHRFASPITPNATPARPHSKTVRGDNDSSLERALEERTTELRQCEQELFELKAQHTQAEALLARERERGSALEATADLREHELSELREKAASLEQRVAQADAARMEAHQGLTALKPRLEDLDNELMKRIDAERGLKEHLATAAKDAKTLLLKVELLEKSAVNKAEETERLKAELARAHTQAAKSDAAMDALRAEVEQAVARSVADESRYAAEKEDLDAAQEALSAALTEVARLADELGDAQRWREETQMRLEGLDDALGREKARGDAAEVARDGALAQVAELEGEIAELRDAREADAVAIERLKKVFFDLREAQMISLAAVEDKVGSVHSSVISRRVPV